VGGTIVAAGLASAIFLLIKSVLQIPLARYIDATDHRVRWMIIGGGIVGIVPFLYLFVTDITAVYGIQVVRGVGSALLYPAWLGLWSTHLDKHKESFEWSVYSTAVSLGAAVTASVGAAMAQTYGFQPVFIMAGIMTVVSWIILFSLQTKNGKGRAVRTIVHHHQKEKQVAVIPK
jgi:MFS family permease